MSPTHRAEDGEDLWITPVARPENPSGSIGTPPPAPGNALDSLVDHLARTHADAQEPTPETVEEDVEDARPEPPLLGEELATASGFLDFLRATIEMKCGGLTDDQASSAPLGSLTSAIGLVRHLADVERYWFRGVIGGIPREEVGYRWMDASADGDPDAEFRLERDASLAEALADYREACETSRKALVGRGAADEVRGARTPRTVRWVVVHMIEETARHVGHLDAVVELVDGRTGE